MIRVFLASLIAFVVALPAFQTATAQEAITILEDSQTNNWPNDLVFTLKAKSASPITRVQLTYSFGSDSVGGAGSPRFEQGLEVTAESTIRTGGQNLVPPGAAFTYIYTIEDQAGNRLRTEPKTYVYLDKRFQWKTMSEGLLTIYYHDIPESRPQAFMQAANTTIREYSQQAGVQLKNKVNISFYNSLPELDVAMNNRSQSSQGSVLGAHYPGFYTIVATDDPRDPKSGTNTMSHEIAHVITYEATKGSLSDTPAWLNEGLSVYFQESKGIEYTQIVPNAARAGRLLPLRYMTAYPGKAEENLLLYGQGGLIVGYLIKTHGPEKMAQLLQSIKDGLDIDRALMRVYGVNREGLDAEWQKSIGAPPQNQQPSLNPTTPAGQPTPPAARGPNNNPPVPTPASANQPRPAGIGGMLPIVIGVSVVGILALVVLGGVLVAVNRNR